MAQAENANPLYRAWTAGKREVEPISAKPTLASAIQIGNPVSAPRAIQALEAMNGVVEQASEEELCDAAARADRTGHVHLPAHRASASPCSRSSSREASSRRGERVVCVSTASGLKFTEFKVALPRGADRRRDEPLANPPVFLPPDYGQVVDAINQRFS